LNARVLHWTPLPSTRALIFDCDGTLADTMPVHHRAWLALLSQHGLDFPEVQFYAFAGMPSTAIIRRLAHEQGASLADDQIEQMAIDKEQGYLAMIDEVHAIAEVYAIAERYRGVLPMAVASGGEGWVVARTLEAIGVSTWMDAVVGAEDTERHKPEPDVFLEAARRLGVDPAACTVFEDSDLGLQAGRSAGMQSIDIRPWR
jgi:beta-phosphoglucomutase-like phosphatase (HAD superfamily)